MSDIFDHLHDTNSIWLLGFKLGAGMRQPVVLCTTLVNIYGKGSTKTESIHAQATLQELAEGTHRFYE